MENQTQKVQKPRKLSKRQQGFVVDYLKTGNGAEAARNNYNIVGKSADGIARSIASENLTKPAIVSAIEEGRISLKDALIHQGVTPKKIANRINFLLDSDQESAIDKGLKHATTIYGVVTEDTQKQNNNTYNFIFSPDVQDEVKSMEERIKEKLLNSNVQKD